MNNKDIKELEKYLDKAYRATLEKILLNIFKSWTIEKAKAAIFWGHWATEEEVMRDNLEAIKSASNSPLRLIKSPTGEQQSTAPERLQDLTEKKNESLKDFINAGPYYPPVYWYNQDVLDPIMTKPDINNLNKKIEKLQPATIRIMLCDVLWAGWQIEDAELLVRRAEINEKLEKQEEYTRRYSEKLASEYNTIVPRLKAKNLI